MELQAEISRKKNEDLIGTIQRVMIDGTDDETQQLHGRTQAHAPEVDGVVYITGADTNGNDSLGLERLAEVRDNRSLEYDLIGEIATCLNERSEKEKKQRREIS